ncbi:MAG: hypothetical protein ACAH17_01575 [Candidatus Paceibacterota bacterium]
MPFSFKPDISAPSDAPLNGTTLPSATLAGSPSSMMARAQEEGKSIFQLVLMFLAGGSVLAAIGMFGYSYYLGSQVEGKKAKLASYETQLAGLPLEDMRKLSNRIKILNQLVKTHPSANVAFRIVEDSVENQVTYNKFDLNYSESAKGYTLVLSGVAPDYKGVAQQIDTFKRKPYTTYISGVTVEGLSPDKVGKISFNVKMPIAVLGLLPEDVNLSEGAAERVASSTPETDQTTSSSTQTSATATASTTP